MAKYRKKPVVIEAQVFKKGMEDGIRFRHQLSDFAKKKLKGFEMSDPHGTTVYPYIDTLEGQLFIEPGDYIITGIQGERYPCKPDIFEKTYETVEGE
jgi:hypothetical protein